MQNYLSRKTGQKVILSGTDIFIYFQNSLEKVVCFLIQLYGIFAKFHIHKMKVDKMPKFLLNDIYKYADTIYNLNNKKAVKTLFKKKKQNH